MSSWKGTDAFRAGKYHAEADMPSNLAYYTAKTFGWYDYLEGQSAGYNEQRWYYERPGKDAAKAAEYKAKYDAVKAQLKEAGR